MAKLCYDLYGHTHDIVAVFANTGCEHEETLRFTDAVDRHFCRGELVWIEPEFHEHGKGPTAKIVNYETASRDGEPFHAAIEKHGIFCQTHPQCTSRLKEEPMISYRRSIGWGPGSYETAIGIRCDEIDRCSSKAMQKRFIYPLVRERWDRQRVNDFMAQFDWDLNLPSDAYGNCVWCWKKSLRKLMTLANESPEVFEFPAKMEHQYGERDGRQFFRENRTTKDIFKEAETRSFRPFRDNQQMSLFGWDEDLDTSSGCGESCEIGADE